MSTAVFPSSMDIRTKSGSKVKAIFRFSELFNGTTADKEHASKYLKPGKEYTVDKTVVYDWHTSVYLKEFPRVPFNSVHFENV